jgi:hypothetical protein
MKPAKLHLDPRLLHIQKTLTELSPKSAINHRLEYGNSEGANDNSPMQK